VGRPNTEAVYRTLQQQGLPAPAAAGVIGNLVAESGNAAGGDLNPRAVGDGGTSHGIAQWHNERWTALQAWAGKQGADPYSLTTQTAFLVKEAKDIGIWDQLRRTTDVYQATKLWMTKFERPKDQSDAAARRRMEAGRQALAGLSPTGSGLDLGNLGKAAGAVGDAVTGGFEAVAGVGKFFDHLLWWFNPTHIIRVTLGVTGVALMLLGLVLLTREVRS
jgi:hypothetical protein